MSTMENRTVLIVDDEGEVVEFLKMALEDDGFDVQTAADGLAALEIVRQQKVDLISLDLVMPKYSGAKFYRELQKNEAWKNIPILIVTGHAKDDLGRTDLEQLTMSGPGIYLEKPIKPTEYVRAIRDMLKMEPSAESAGVPDTVALKERLMDLMEKADEQSLKRVLQVLDKENT